MKKNNVFKKFLRCFVIIIIFCNLFLLPQQQQASSGNLLDIHKIAYADDENVELPPDIEEPFSMLKWLKELFNLNNEQSE